jgi:hypothetical protein
MWEFTSLPDAATDIKVVYSGNVWWHKGMTKHSVDAIFYATPTPVTDNYFRNAGFEGGPAGPWTVTNVQQAVFGSWLALNGTGSSAALSRELTTKSADSLVAAKIVQTKVSGSLQLYQNFAVPSSMRGKTVSVSFQVQQSVAAAVRAYVGDTAGTTFSSTSSTTGSFITLTATRTIDAAATIVQAGIYVDLSATVYADDGIWSLGAVPATYRPEYFSAYTLTEDLLADTSVSTRTLQDSAVTTAKITDLAVTTPKLADLSVTTIKHADLSVTTPKLADGSVTAVKIVANTITNAQLAAGVAVANLGYTPVNKAGDTMTGDLTVNRSGSGTPGSGVLLFGNSGSKFIFFDGTLFNFTSPLSVTGGITASQDSIVYRAGAPTTGYLGLGSTLAHYIGFDGANIVTETGKVWTQGNDGAGSGLDADTVDGLNPSNASGQIPISNGAVCTNLNADTVDGIHGTAFAQLSTAGNQTIVSNTAQLLIGVIPSGPLSGTTGVWVAGNFSASGTKNRIATGHDGTQGVFHSFETPLPMFMEVGRSSVSYGRAFVEMPQDFANYVDLSDYHVFLQAEVEAALYVEERTPSGFMVRSDKLTYVPFSWTVVARQGDMGHIERNLPLAADEECA